MSRAEPTTAPTPVPALAGRRAYAPPQHQAPIDLVLSGNEGDHPDPALLDELRGREVALLRSYPSAKSLERALAARLRVDPEQVVVTAGGDEAIDRVCRAFLTPGRRVVMPQPTFVMLPHYAALTGAAVDAVDWPEGPYPRAAVLAAVRDDTAMITVVTPNNPTGAVATADDLRSLAERAPHALLLVDLAYAEYADADADLTRAALALPNAVVVRTVSKAWGLAGLRVGYAVGPPALIAPLRAAGGPYSVSGLSLALVERALARGAQQSARHVATVRRERVRLSALLNELGLHSPPSQGNFALARTPDPRWLRDGLAGLGIGVRIFPGAAGLEDACRITCPGDDLAFERLARALRAVLRPQALLFDMDGVLTDLSGRGSAAGALLPRREWLARTAARLPLGIVTGLRRAEVQAWLSAHGLGGTFGTVVGSDDAPAKPDPAPVRLALECLGVERAWMIGDSAADVHAARAAGVVPLGVVAPGSDGARASEALLRAGAARVLDAIDSLEEVLP